jgi:hypothetical protein
MEMENRVGNQNLGIKKEVELYSLTNWFYYGDDDEDQPRDLPATTGGTR